MNAKTVSLILVALLWGCTNTEQVLANQSQSGALGLGDAGHSSPDAEGDGGCGADDGNGGVVDAGPVAVPDAGTSTCADAGVVCDAKTCAGCCINGRCEPGTFNYLCGSGGAACQSCAANTLCSGGQCTATSNGVDLVVESVRLTDFYRSTTELRFTAYAVIANIGQQAAAATSWGVIYSTDSYLSLLHDTIESTLPTPPLAAGSRVTVSGRVSIPVENIRSSKAYAFAFTDINGVQLEDDERNNSRISDVFDTASVLCGPGVCAGCCTPEGCTIEAEESDATCGLAGGLCSTCTNARKCTAGVCQ